MLQNIKRYISEKKIMKSLINKELSEVVGRTNSINYLQYLFITEPKKEERRDLIYDFFSKHKLFSHLSKKFIKDEIDYEKEILK